MKVGLHQQSVLNLLLFTIVMDYMARPLQREAPWDMLFVDDIVLCEDTCEEVERRKEGSKKAMEDRGMQNKQTEDE